MKIGDKVRFLSETGGGKIAGFKGDLVLVEDEDGFQIPTLKNEVVVVTDEDFSTKHLVEVKQQKKIVIDDNEDYDPADRPVTFKAPSQDRKGGELLSAYIAFVPIDVNAITNSRFETYIVNDCNYSLHYVYMIAEGNAWQVRSIGDIDPNTKVFIEEFGHADLSSMERMAIQLTAYKHDKPFLIKPVVDMQMRIDGVKFYKLHSFEENDFFEQPAIIYTIIENDVPARPLVIDAKKLKQEMVQKANADKVDVKAEMRRKAKEMAKKDKNAPIVIDLHAGELLETTAGMSASDILNYQLETMRKTMQEYIKEKGRKIVFIHGKGEGVLRQAVINELRYRYKNCPYQDASFQEYGYGATQVTIK
ncbi:MAG: DUF2027 domain-containing protein [Prevotella sp.]|nr:DUF2027 domain-containing protein [Prevotella sp.]